MQRNLLENLKESEGNLGKKTKGKSAGICRNPSATKNQEFEEITNLFSR